MVKNEIQLKPLFVPLQTLFNPNKTVVKMFVVMYDLSDMPPNSQTFLRQRTVYMPTGKNLKGEKVTKDHLETFLRYLIHLRYVDCNRPMQFKPNTGM